MRLPLASGDFPDKCRNTQSMKRQTSARATVFAIASATIALAGTPTIATAQTADGASDGAALAKKLSNPVAALISVPFQYNYNEGYGDGSGKQSYHNIQPVIPISISPTWNVISRTIIPLVDQEDIRPGAGTQTGIGNITQSLFFSPKEPTAGGLIWGVGPVLQIPTATDDIAPDQWGAGITGVVLTQVGPWTYGALANHVWSISDTDRYGQQSATFLQPFVSHTTPKATSFTLNTESTYNWETEEWSVPINVVVAQVVKLGNQPVQFGIGARYWAEAPDGGPDDWGLRAQVTFLFPK
jgi:hypothetical protein